MSFNRLNWDNCTYKQDLKQSIGTADYILGTPRVECRACFSTDPAMRMSSVPRISTGISTCLTTPLIDVDSELKLITRKASNCPTDKYLPSEKPFCKLSNFPDCQSLPREDTRLSNPPCTLRCSGWNRWEWLCKNPQENSLVPFDFNINNRIIAKDNHRPCLQEPINQSAALPLHNQDDSVVAYDTSSCMRPSSDIPSTHWRSCKTYAGYVGNAGKEQ